MSILVMLKRRHFYLVLCVLSIALWAAPASQSYARGVAEMGVPQMVPDRGTRIIFYCAGGGRSLLAADSLRQMGYESVESMAGGYQAWTQSGYKSAR